MTQVYSLFSQTSRHPKILKNGLEKNIYSLIMHLAPADRSGYEVCPMRSAGCTLACLNTAGFHYSRKEEARISRTKLYFEHREKFMQMMVSEIKRGKRYAEKNGYLFGVRLNGTSDIPWENVQVRAMFGSDDHLFNNIMEVFPDVPFYDYTKRWNRKDLPNNYRLTFSRAEDNDERCVKAIENGMNIAVVFNTKKDCQLPVFHKVGEKSFPVIDGDSDDWRFGDYDTYQDRVVVGLRAKGKAKHDTSGFVINV